VKITQDDVVDRQTVLHIELEDDDIDPYLDRAYQRVVQRVNIPGFRKGKAPRRIIEQYFGRESMLNEVLDSMLPELTNQAINEKDLDAVGLPSIEMEELDPFQFSAIVPLRPEVDLGEYSEIRIEKEHPKIEDDAVDSRIEQLRLSVATWEPTERPIEIGDMITAQIKGTVGEKTIFDESDAVYLVNEEIGRPFPGFSEKLVGMEPDKPSQFDLSIPEDFADPDLANQDASFDVTIKDIKARVLPEIDDEFAKSIGEGHETLGDLKEEVQKSIQTEAEEEITRTHRESIVEALMDTAKVEMSALLLQHEAEHMVEEQERMVSQANMNMDDYLASLGKTREEFVEESKTEASDRLKRSFVLAKLAEEEGLEVSDEDIDDRITEMFSNAEQEIPESSQNAQMRDYLSRSLLMEETMKKLEGIAAGESEQELANQEPDVEDVDDGSSNDNKDQETEEGEVNA
jgi:trigger factor|tara:strand:- start:10476 stop:11852 length:1377 start_codon:yes stop_codon:yes gene_type:complete